jgi:hypothetical protein
MNRYTLLILLSALLASCANTKAESEDYVISADRNDIKEKDPELWSWIETQSKSIRSKEKQAKAIYPKQLEYVKSLTDDPKQIEKRQAFNGVWVDCYDNGLGKVYIFQPNGEFHSFEKRFNSSDCTGSTKPGLAGFGFEFQGYYLVGKMLETSDSGNIHELDLVHTDNERSKNYDESKTYYKVAQVNNAELRFSSRGNPSVLLPPKKRNLRLDKVQYTYNKCNCTIEVE